MAFQVRLYLIIPHVQFSIFFRLIYSISAYSSIAVDTKAEFHVEFKPPPDGSYTGVNQERVVPANETSAPSQDAQDDAAPQQGTTPQGPDSQVTIATPLENAEQLQQRIVAYSEAFPKLERLYTKFNRLVKIDAKVDATKLYEELRDALQKTLDHVRLITSVMTFHKTLQ